MRDIKKYALVNGILVMLFICYTITNGQENLWSCNGPQGASVQTIAINPLNHAMIYIGTVQNGIYKSINAGDSWTHIRSNVLYSNQRVIVIHPTAPDTIYAATNGGLFKSTNSGNDWSMLEPPRDTDEEYRALVINPDHPNVLFAGGPFDQWRSTNGGQNWDQLNINPQVGIDGFAIDPQNSDIMYLVSGSVVYGLGIWKSLDMGQSWFPIQNNIDSSNNSFGIDVAIDPVNTDILYFARNSEYSQLQRCLSKSVDGGASWSDITPDNLTEHIIFRVKVLSTNHDIIFACTSKDGIMKSSDGGATWQKKNNGLKTLGTKAIAIDSASGIIYLGTYYDGIYKSIDMGESWEPISYNINAANCRGLSINFQNQYEIFTTAINGLFGSDDGGSVWHRINIPIPIYNTPEAILIDEINPRIIFVTDIQRSPPNVIEPAGVYISTDSGVSWAFSNNGLDTTMSFSDIAVSYSDAGQRRIFIAANGTHIVDAGGLFYSDDMGENWILCHGGLPSDIPFSVVEVAPSNPNLIAVGEGGAFDQKIYISMDRGASWVETTPLPPPINPYPYITSIAFDPVNANHFYISSDYLGLYETTDLGQSWINKTEGLPPDPQDSTHIVISGVAINPQNPQNIFVQPSWRGIYQSHDGGSTWEPFNDGLDTAMAYGKIYFAPNDTNYLFMASTHSIWSIHRTLDDIENDKPLLPDKTTLSSYPNPFNSSTTISFILPKEEHISLSLYDITGRKLSTMAEGPYPAGSHSLNLNLKEHASGIYYLRLDTDDAHITRKMVMIK